jgi:putative transcriptional regulator
MLVEHDGRAYGLFFTLRSERFRDLGAAQSEEARRLGEELPREPWPETPRLDLPLATACGQPVAAVSALEVRALRHRSKLSQAGFARRYGIPIGTLRDWEQGRSAPGACGRAYLAVIALAPELVMRALRACRALAMNGPPVVC